VKKSYHTGKELRLFRHSVLTLLVGLLVLTNCKYPKRGESRNHAPIIEDFELPPCYSIGTYTNESCVVRHATDFAADTSGNCPAGPIEFDFNAYSVLGVTITYGCSARIVRELKIDHPGKRYVYTVKYKEAGLCKKLGYDFNLVKVPAIPPDYTVVFDVRKE
jgi:hypothetical protein